MVDTKPRRITLIITDPSHSTSPQYIALLAEELQRILAAHNFKLEEVSDGGMETSTCDSTRESG